MLGLNKLDVFKRNFDSHCLANSEQGIFGLSVHVGLAIVASERLNLSSEVMTPITIVIEVSNSYWL